MARYKCRLLTYLLQRNNQNFHTAPILTDTVNENIRHFMQAVTALVTQLSSNRSVAYRQSLELSNEEQIVRESRATPIRVGTSQSNPVHGNAQLGQSEEIYSQSRPGNSVPLANLGGHVATDFPASHLQSNPMGSGRQVPSPVVPTPQPFEYYSSGMELDSVMQNVQRVFDPQMRDQTVYQIDTTIAPIVRQYSTSSVDSIAANMECIDTAPLVCPTIQQVSQVLPAEPRAEGARLTAREERVTKYPGELRAQDARVSTPQGSCGHPADLHTGNARQAAQVQRMNGHTTGILQVM